MTATAIIQIYVFVLAAFVGYQVITRVPPLLHTPLMSATNAMSAISLVGSVVIAGAALLWQRSGRRGVTGGGPRGRQRPGGVDTIPSRSRV